MEKNSKVLNDLLQNISQQSEDPKSSFDKNKRIDLCRELASFDDSSSIENLFKTLAKLDSSPKKQNNYGVAREALEACYQALDPNKAIPILDQFLMSVDSGYVSTAISLLRLFNSHQQAFNSLLPLLNHENSEIRRKALTSLRIYWGEGALHNYAFSMVDDSDEGVVEEAVYLLRSHDSDDSLKKLIEAVLKFESKKIIEECEYQLRFNEKNGRYKNEQIVRVLTELLAHEDVRFRRFASYELYRDHHKAVIPDLIKALNDPDNQVRLNVIESLGIFGQKKTSKSLFSLLEDDVEDVRVEAAHSLGRIGSVNSIKPLIKAFSDRASEVRVAVIKGLSQINDIRAYEVFLRALEDEESRVKIEAVKALGRLGEQKALTSVMGILDRVDHEVSLNKLTEIVNSVSLLGGKNIPPKVIDIIKSYFSEFLDEFHPKDQWSNSESTELKLISLASLAKAAAMIGVVELIPIQIKVLMRIEALNEDYIKFAIYDYREQLIQLEDNVADSTKSLVALLSFREFSDLFPDFVSRGGQDLERWLFYLRFIKPPFPFDEVSSFLSSDYDSSVREVAIETLLFFGGDQSKDILQKHAEVELDKELVDMINRSLKPQKVPVIIKEYSRSDLFNALTQTVPGLEIKKSLFEEDVDDSEFYNWLTEDVLGDEFLLYVEKGQFDAAEFNELIPIKQNGVSLEDEILWEKIEENFDPSTMGVYGEGYFIDDFNRQLEPHELKLICLAPLENSTYLCVSTKDNHRFNHLLEILNNYDFSLF